MSLMQQQEGPEKNQACTGIRTLTSAMPVQANVLFWYFLVAPHPHDPASI